MAHHSKFLSVNLNKSYGKSSSSSSYSTAAGYENGRSRSSGSRGGMVVLSRPRSSSGASAHKPSPRLAVPPPVNLPSLRREHERLDPVLSKPSSGHGGSGLGIGNNPSMSWIKPTPQISDFSDKDGGSRTLSIVEQRSFSSSSQPQSFREKTVILKGEDFPSLMATSAHFSKQKQKQASENSDGWAEKSGLSSVRGISPQLRSLPPTKKNIQGNEGGSNQFLDSLEQSRQGAGNFAGPLPLVRPRHASDWDDDERDRNHVDHYDGRVFPNGETRFSLSRDSCKGDPYGKEFMAFKKEDHNFSTRRVTVETNREILTSRVLHVDKDHFGSRNSALIRGTGKESIHGRLSYVDRKDFDSGMGIGNAGVTEGSNDRAEVSNNWQRGKPFTNSTLSMGPMSPRIKCVSINDPVQNFSKEKFMSNVGRSYDEDASWGGKDSFSSDSMLDLKVKVIRKKKEAVKRTDLFDPARESFEAELERVQQLQEQERRRVIEEQARVMEVARREVEERERIAREEEERRRLVEKEVREAAWRAEQEKLEAARRAEELRIAREEEKKKIVVEEERRKEAARQKLLELEARIASRQTEANVNDRMKERNSLRNSDLVKCGKNETMVEHFASSSSFDSSSMNKLFDAGFRPHTSSAENYSFAQRGKRENNWSNSKNTIIKFQEQDSDYLTAQHDELCSNRSFHMKQVQVSRGPKPVTPSFKRGMSGDQAQTGQRWDRNRDCDQFNGRSSIFGEWDHSHFDGSHLTSYSERSFQNSEVDDQASFSRVRHRHAMRQPRVPPPPAVPSSIYRNTHGVTSVGPNSSFSVHSDTPINQSGREEESDVQIVYGCSYHQRILEPEVEPIMPELLEEPACSLLQTDEKSNPRYDSQSSLSVSNPPSSPTQLSHDEFDDCGGSPAMTTSAEEENMIFSEEKSMIPELDAGKIDAEIIPFSHGEDDDWAIEVHEEMEAEEDHNEGPDSNQEDNEPHESDAWELQIKNKREDLNVVVEKPMEIGHIAYGIESHVHSGDSGHYLLNKDSDYYDKASMNGGHASDSIAEHIFVDNRAGSLQLEETIPAKILNASSDVVEEIVKEHEDMIFGLVTSADHPTDGIRAFKNSVQNPIAAVSRLPLPSTSSLYSISASVPTSSGQTGVPAKLHFGLFSSPPLIPSPLPTIQIGSIQMPLPLNAQIDSYTHLPHPPLLQFGQIVYTPPTSQNVLPIPAQTLSYTPMADHLINCKSGSFSKVQVSQDSTSTKGLYKGKPSSSADKQPICTPGITNPSQSNLDFEETTALLDLPRDDIFNSKKRITLAVSDEKKDFHNLISHSGNPDSVSNKNFRSMAYSKRTRGRPHVGSFSSARKSLATLKTPGTMSEISGNRLTYNIRNAGSLSSFTRAETSYVNTSRPQRMVRRHIQGTEYRVKESGAKQMQCAGSFNYSFNSGNNLVGIPLRNVGKKVAVTSKSTNLMNEEAALSGSQVVSVINNKKKEILQTSMPASSNFHGGEGNLNKNGLLEEDIDAPLLSGIVRVFNQPGIEASSDGDGFVEVRSKRKISNERRGQRERETNPKHKATRVPHRHSATFSSNGIAYKSDFVTTMTGGAAARRICSDPAIAHRMLCSDLETAKLTETSMTCQTIAAISSSDVNSADYDSKFNSLKSSHAGSDLAIANDGANAEPSLSFGNSIIALDKAPVPLGTWGIVHLKQQAGISTQSNLDETLNPVQCNPVGIDKVFPNDNKRTTTNMTKEKKSFSSENLPNFFDGEKIQFGAVISPPHLPPSSQAAPDPIWSPGSVMLNSSIIHNLDVNDHSERIFFDKEKCPSESRHLDDTEAEAEAAASAIAVAVITNDEMNVSTLRTGSISSIAINGLGCPGVTSCTDTTCQVASEGSLIVTLPADLSVDTPLSLWPPLPTLQPSRPMLSHIAGPQPSPFSFIDSNSMLGGPIFTFRSQDESIGTQAQQQQSPTFVSGPTGTWPQCHSGVESSFYGSPAGFPTPFMSSLTGLSGVHGHPPMVFYNHFTPVGQFGQVGLSYMGGTYLPTGKQPDWKHSSDTAIVNVSKTDPSNLNVVYGQQNTAHVPTSIQHLSTGSGVMQVTSPFTLFNLRPPFLSSTEIPVPTQWPLIPHAHSPNSIGLSAAPEQLQRLPSDLPHSTTTIDLPDELSLVESSSSNTSCAHTIQSSTNHSTASIKNDSNGSIPSPAIGNADKPSCAPSQKMSSGNQYGRRNPFHGKFGNNNSPNKNIRSSKMKQVYVAKSVLTSCSTTK